MPIAESAERRLLRSWWRPQRDALARTLVPLAWLYGRLAALQRRRRATRIDVPVVVVGNLIAGGAGKTPTVIAIVRLLRGSGWSPGVVSRGYGRRGDETIDVERTTAPERCGDEPLLIRLRTQAPVVVGRDRVAAARELRRRHPRIDIVVSDDGLQHRALGRDAEVIVFDQRGVGNGLLLPAGPLREPLPAALPPTSLVLYNADAPSTPLPGWTARRRLAGVVELAGWWAGEAPRGLDVLRGRPLVAAAGIAEPERFFRMLEANGLAIERCTLPDHHRFTTLPWRADATDVVVTEKDAVKLDPAAVGRARVWVAALDFEPDPAFDAALLRLLRR